LIAINASSRPDHVSSTKTHKQRVRDYLKILCSQAGLSSPDLLADQLFLIGEGLIVSMQVMGCSEPISKAAKHAAALLLRVSEQGRT